MISFGTGTVAVAMDEMYFPLLRDVSFIRFVQSRYLKIIFLRGAKDTSDTLSHAHSYRVTRVTGTLSRKN